jgi:hypothetical protein
VNDKHLPGFDFDGYPIIDDEEYSPRLSDDIWQKYEKMSMDELGATNLRHEPQLLDRIIQVF